MVDPDLTRSDWLNEAAGPPQWQNDDDVATMQQASSLCHSIIDIGVALSRSELDTAARKLREMDCHQEPYMGSLAQVVAVVDDYRAQFLNAWATGGVSAWREGLHDELKMALEDVDALAKDDR